MADPIFSAVVGSFVFIAICALITFAMYFMFRYTLSQNDVLES